METSCRISTCLNLSISRNTLEDYHARKANMWILGSGLAISQSFCSSLYCRSSTCNQTCMATLFQRPIPALVAAEIVDAICSAFD
jgi:hypothetical protein